MKCEDGREGRPLSGPQSQGSDSSPWEEGEPVNVECNELEGDWEQARQCPEPHASSEETEMDGAELKGGDTGVCVLGGGGSFSS